jgi:hypothetical protein
MLWIGHGVLRCAGWTGARGAAVEASMPRSDVAVDHGVKAHAAGAGWRQRPWHRSALQDMPCVVL